MSDDPATSIPAVTYVVLGLLGLVFYVEATSEPYPSITMPGFHAAATVADSGDIGVRHLRIEYEKESLTLSAHDLFATAPENQRFVMLKRLDLTGNSDQWDWIDEVSRQNQRTSAATAAELVIIRPNGDDRVLQRIDRDS